MTVSFNELTTQYLSGAEPAELVRKYPDCGFTAKQLSDKFNYAGLTKAKRMIADKITEAILKKTEENVVKTVSDVQKKKILTQEEVLQKISHIAESSVNETTQLKACELLGKKYGLFVDKIEQSGNVGITDIVINRKPVKKNE